MSMATLDHACEFTQVEGGWLCTTHNKIEVRRAMPVFCYVAWSQRFALRTRVCERCGADYPLDQSCGCFDNGAS
jgi:hypothetical protein